MRQFARGVVMIAILAAASVRGLADDALPGLAQAAKQYDFAQVRSDRAALGRPLANDDSRVNGATQVSSKTKFIADSVASGFSIQPFEIEPASNMVWTGGTAAGRGPASRHIGKGAVCQPHAGCRRRAQTQWTLAGRKYRREPVARRFVGQFSVC